MKSTRLHYGWVVCIICVFVLIGTSLLSTSMSINLANIRAHTDLTGTQTSMILTVRSVIAFLMTLVIDKYYQKFNIRMGLFLAEIVGAIVFVIFAFADSSAILYYIGGGLAGITYSLALMVPVGIIIRRWFNSYRSTAIAICSCGTGVAFIIASPVLNYLVNTMSLKVSFLAQAGFMVLSALLVLFFLSNDPAEKNLEPLGGIDAKVANKKSSRGSTAYANCSLDSGYLWVMAFVMVLFGGSSGPVTAHFILAFNTCGIDTNVVATASSIFGITLIIGKILYGRLIDAQGARKATNLFVIPLAVFLFLVFITTTTQSVPIMYVAYLGAGIFLAPVTIAYNAWCNDFTRDEKEYTVTMKRWMVGYYIGTTLLSSVPGIIADKTGSYGPAYVLFAALWIVILVFMNIGYKKLKKNTL